MRYRSLSTFILSLITALTVTAVSPRISVAQSALTKVSELAAGADTIRVLNPGAAEPLLLLSQDAEKKLLLFKVAKGAAVKVAESASIGHVWEATLLGDQKSGSIIVGYGLGRGDLNAPLRIVSYPLTLDAPTELKIFPTERAQVNSMNVVGNDVVLTYFTAKYDTETGRLFKDSSGNWQYEKTVGMRMGTSSDAHGEQIVIGRMYGDKQLQDGDLMLKVKGQEVIKLPSYRGVSSVAFYPVAKDGRPEILVGDGWHSNYGQLAEARLSRLIPVNGSARYALDLIHTFTDSYAVNRIMPTAPAADAPVMVMTNNHLYLATPGNEWKFSDLYTQKVTDKVFDVQYVGQNGSDLFVLVSDGSAVLYKVTR